MVASHSVCDEQNYQQLYQEYMDSLRNYLYYQCGDLLQAEDLAQEAYVKLWMKCAEVVWETAKGFLFTAAKRLMLNMFSHQKVVLNFEKNNPTYDRSPDPDFVLAEQEFKSKLEAAIGELPERQRSIFLLNRIDKMSYKEIADHLDISVKAVEKSLGKVMKKLRESVEELKIHKI